MDTNSRNNVLKKHGASQNGQATLSPFISFSEESFKVILAVIDNAIKIYNHKDRNRVNSVKYIDALNLKKGTN